MLKPVWLVLGVVAGGLTLVGVMANEKPSEAYMNAMKNMQSAQMAMRASVTAKDYDAIAKHAATFKASFDFTEQFWVAKKVDDAIAAARAGGAAATDLATAATSRNDEGIAAAQRALGATCMGCHAAHRERLPDGTSEIK